MKTSEYLDLAQKLTGTRNDNQLMKVMGWKPSQVNNYRHDRQPMDNEQARQIAEITNIPVLSVIVDMELIRAERQNDVDKTNAWKKLARLSKEAGAATLGVMMMVGSITAVLPVVFELTSYTLCEPVATRK